MTESTSALPAAGPDRPDPPDRPDRPSRCSNCDARLPETPVSLCPYCAMPILGGVTGSGDGSSPNAERIERIPQHPDYPAALARTPPAGPDHERGSRWVFRGRGALVIAALLAGVFALGGARGVHPALVAAATLAVMGLVLVGRGVALRRRAWAKPLLKRPGVITDRRSETVTWGWGGDTTYFFTIELEGGVRGEFAYPGRGAHADPYAVNLPGLAITRGQTLVHFEHLRLSGNPP